MVASASEQCRTCITTLKTIVSTLSNPDRQKGRVHHEQINDELERFSLWMGNIGALHLPESSMSLESRLREANDVLTHILELLDDLNEVAGELLRIVSGEREGEIASVPHDDGKEEDQNEETELLREFGACITRLFRVSSLIRQAAPTDLFAKALSRNRYRFNDQFDIAHVGEKYPKLTTGELAWLQKRLGHAITQRRHYLSYIRDHHEELEGKRTHEQTPGPVVPKSQAPIKQLPAMKVLPDSSSRPSTFFTKASSLTPGQITPQMLATEEESDPENDARSYTTISRSIDGDLDPSATVRIPNLDELRTGSKKEVECPFCFRMKKFKNERVWRRHVFSDLRSYVCTFQNCDAPYFGDINEWFSHEMRSHRVSYICRLCQNKAFQIRERYLAHVRKQHPNMLEDGEEQLVLDIARKPLDQIPAQECPCCSGWIDRLRERAAAAGIPSDASDHILSVVPTVFKRHLASHLEQLALFAISIGSAAEGCVNSNAAIEEDVRPFSGGSDISTLAFDSSRPSSPATTGQLSDDVPIPEGLVAAPAVVQRKVQRLLDKMTPDKFERIADQILEIAAQSKNETDGRTLRQVVQLIMENVTDEAYWASTYALICERMLKFISPDIKDENIKDKYGNVVTGGALFRKYLLGRCQEEFQRGWKVNMPPTPEGQTEEAALMSEECHIALVTKRRGLGLVKFIGELYKVGMLTERIIHECIKELLNLDESGLNESKVESLITLLNTVGLNLEQSGRSPALMNIYFERITSIMNHPDLPSRLKSKLLDVINLRKHGWQFKDDDKGPKTFTETHADVQRKQQAELERLRHQASNRSGGGRLAIGRPPIYSYKNVGTNDL
ncbi:hypothetical protein EPUS_09435 [Endocarpon pusillum Z07020]|uniref:MIF4G domain-containing protein n=1 Tax=Endocarpon pusillum (strain Z07020 / HMAS-L-300199) TaxID=1263415 RepID=U1GW78_ENDPU|nr:uncharacterized protein EPUS_09435 [Endocarpon pusillum Z07020]ERF76351.1 hypothetical protein EPUS_09435 [Endocarpon pusillum Z07020]